jgi:hypothetical protein
VLRIAVHDLLKLLELTIELFLNSNPKIFWLRDYPGQGDQMGEF